MVVRSSSCSMAVGCGKFFVLLPHCSIALEEEFLWVCSAGLMTTVINREMVVILLASQVEVVPGSVEFSIIWYSSVVIHSAYNKLNWTMLVECLSVSWVQVTCYSCCCCYHLVMLPGAVHFSHVSVQHLLGCTYWKSVPCLFVSW